MDDLVLLRRFDLRARRGRKLEARWSRPYQVRRVLRFKRSVLLADLPSGLIVGKFHLDDIKPFVPRKGGHATEEALELAARNQEQRHIVEGFIKEYRRLRHRPMEQSIMTVTLQDWGTITDRGEGLSYPDS